MSSGKLNPVAWMEGMFLRPQHLQQNDLSSEARLRYHLHALNPFHWGVREIAFDEEALAENRIVVTRLEAVLRDGTLVKVPGNARIESRTFAKGQERVSVYLALRSWSDQDPNLETEETGALKARNRLRALEIPDANRGGLPSAVEVLEPNLRLLLTGEEPELGLYEAFKLAEIETTEDSKRPYALAKTYVPPLLALQASPVLLDAFSRVTSQAGARVRAAAAMTRLVSVDSLPRLFMRYTLARLAPLLKHLLSTGESHPFPVYTALIELAGAVTAYRLEHEAEFPQYDHENLHGCFIPLLTHIASELDRIAPENFKKLALEYDPASAAYATKALDMKLLQPGNAFYLAVKAPVAQAELESFMSLSKAGSAKHVQMLRRINLPSLPIQRLPGQPGEIEALPGYTYYAIDSQAKDFANVRRDFTFALDLGTLTNASVFLYVAFGEVA